MSTASFVDQLYLGFLGRHADAGGLAYWSQLLDSGQTDAFRLTQAFLDSPEFAGAVQPLARLYYAAFDRIPDAAGLSYWTQQVQQGASLDAIARSFVNSPEFNQRFGQLDNHNFLTLLYQHTLGRTPDSAGLQFWQQQLAQGATREAVLRSFSDSPEFAAGHDAAVKVIATYQALLGSTPSTEQLSAALTQADPLALISSLYMSSAYHGVQLPGLNLSDALMAAAIDNASSQISAVLHGLGLGNASLQVESAAAHTVSDWVGAHGTAGLADPANVTGLLQSAAQALQANAQQQTALKAVASAAAQAIATIDASLLQATSLDSAATVTANATALSAALQYAVSSGDWQSINALATASVLTKSFSGGGSTAGTDYVPPVLLGATPSAGGSLTADANLVLTFSESIQAGSGTITITDGFTQTIFSNGNLTTRIAGATDTRTISITDSSQVTINGATLTLNPSADLKPGLTYHVLIGANAVTDLAGNKLLTLIDGTAYTVQATAASNLSGLTINTPIAGDGFINIAEASAGVVFSGDVGAGYTVSLTLGSFTATPTVSSGHWSYSLDSSGISSHLHAGGNTMQLSATDGTHTNSLSTVFSVDTVAPTLTASNYLPGTIGPNQVGLALTGYADDATSVNLIFNNQFTHSATLNSSHWSYTLSSSDLSNLSSGTASVVVQATDSHGNMSSFSMAGTVDHTNPSLVAFSAPDLSSSSSGSLLLTFSETVPSLTAGAFTVTNATFGTPTTSDSGIHWTIPVTATTAGSVSFNLADAAYAKDAVGNAFAPTGISGTFTASTGGLIQFGTISGDGIVSASEAGSGVTFGGTVDNAVTSVVLHFGTADHVATVSSGSWSYVSNASDFIGLSNGAVAATATATTSSGTSSITTNFTYDSVGPSASVGLSDTTLSSGETAQLTVSFSEPVPTLSAGSFLADAATVSNPSHNGNYTVWTVDLTPSSGTTSTGDAVILDLTTVYDKAGNPGVGSITYSPYEVDTVAPSANITFDTTSGIGGSSTRGLTISFSEAVTGLTSADFSATTGGSISGLTQTDSTHWSATFTPSSSTSTSTAQIVLDQGGVTDLHGNAGVGTTNSGTFTVDTVSPTATVTIGDSTLGSADHPLVTISFSESVTGVSASLLSSSDGAFSGFTAVSQSSYTATFTPTANTASASGHISFSTTGVTDLLGNALGSVDTGNAQYSIDMVAPSVTAVTLQDASNVLASDTPDHHAKVATFTFSESMYNLNRDAFYVTNFYGDITVAVDPGHQNVWTATFTPYDNAAAGVSAITLNQGLVADAYGNNGSGTFSSPTFTIDTRLPEATVSVSPSTLNASDSYATVTVHFTEAVQSVNSSYITVPSGFSLSSSTFASDSQSWVGTYALTSASVSASNLEVSIDMTHVKDTAGNSGSTSFASDQFTRDTIAPSVSSVTNSGHSVVIQFSEPVHVASGSAVLTLTPSSGTSLSDYFGSTLSSSATFSFPSLADSTTYTIDFSGLTDSAGNALPAYSSSFVTGDMTAPSAPTSIVVASAYNTGPTNDRSTSNLTLALSGRAEASSTIHVYNSSSTEVATATTNSDGTWTSSSFSVASYTTYTYSVTAVDSAGNISSAANALFTIDNTAPTESTYTVATSYTSPSIDFSFSENIHFDGTTTIAITDDTSVTSFSLAASYATASGSVLSVSLGSLGIVAGHHVSVSLVGTAVTDDAGNSVAGNITGVLTLT